MNTAHPAQCNGTVTSGRYCYYEPNNKQDNRVYYAIVAIYRPMNSSQLHYTKVSDMFSVSRTGREISSGFECVSVNLPGPFDVEVGDVVGVCIFNPSGGSRRQLDLVGESSNDSDTLMGTENAGGCGLDSIPTMISMNQLSSSGSRILHVYSNITSNSGIICSGT